MSEFFENSPLPYRENRAQEFLDWVERLQGVFRNVKVGGSVADPRGEEAHDTPLVDVQLVGLNQANVEIVRTALIARAKLKGGEITEDTGVNPDAFGYNCSLQFEFHSPRSHRDLPLAA